MAKRKTETVEVVALPPITSWEAAEEALGELAKRRAQAAGMEAEFHAGQAEFKRDYAERSAPIGALIEAQEAALQAFAVERREDFGDAKSRELKTGILGWRKTPPKLDLLGRTTWDKVLAAIQSMPRLSKLFVRNAPTVNRDAIHAAYRDDEVQDAELRAVGLKMDEGHDEFYAETTGGEK